MLWGSFGRYLLNRGVIMGCGKGKGKGKGK